MNKEEEIIAMLSLEKIHKLLYYNNKAMVKDIKIMCDILCSHYIHFYMIDRDNIRNGLGSKYRVKDSIKIINRLINTDNFNEEEKKILRSSKVDLENVMILEKLS